MQKKVFEKIFELSPHVSSPSAYSDLRKCTEWLIEMYLQQGRLSEDPFASVWQRTLSLPLDPLKKRLQKSTCLVTGGVGCVGSELVKELQCFDVAQIVVLDIRECNFDHSSSEKLVYVRCDIRDAAQLETVFRSYKPDFVFHAAGQRDPGYAEKHVIETIQTNIIGTLNIVNACECIPGIQQCIFASTGKASRYYTEEVYAATKKICEYILEVRARTSSVIYSLVRFTHILNNSLMHQQLRHASRCERFIPLHCPAKYVTAQNVNEAAKLMLNALVFSADHCVKFLIVKNLEWPVESLEVALYELKESGRPIPIIFQGNPKGYSEKFFRGQLNWSRPDELNLLLNVYEHRFRKINDAEDIIISNITPPDSELVDQLLTTLKLVSSDLDARNVLLQGLRRIVADSLTRVNREDTEHILQWGLDKESMEEGVCAEDFDSITSLLYDSLTESKNSIPLPTNTVLSNY